MTFVLGASNLTIDQSSHNPVTISTANGLTLSGQQVSMGTASSSATGALTSTDWMTFNNGATLVINSLSGDITGPLTSTQIAAGVIVDADISSSAAISDLKLATISTAGKVSNSSTTATTDSTANTLVL
jgi:hypothetical protein